jgi:hypothetical protein
VTEYADFTESEQRLIRSSLYAAAIAVAAASIGKEQETANEGFAAASFILEGGQRYPYNALISAVLHDVESRASAGQPVPDFTELVNAPGAKEAALETLRQVAALLAGKGDSGDAAGFKHWLTHIAQVTASGGLEGGGWFGRGAVQVNEAEVSALTEVAAALGVSHT